PALTNASVQQTNSGQGIVEAASDRSAAEGCRAAPVYPFHDSMIARGNSPGGSGVRYRHLPPQ
ncbi:MAG: hypothetical protein OXB95_05405, partial [Rhodobacteraceae bacterium]|nr:hypothetical protein [Paracoccaceae bacterium]